MISPIKFVVQKVQMIKVVIQDFPLYFNAHFFNIFTIKILTKLQLWLRGRFHNAFNILIQIRMILGIGVKPIDNFNIVSHFKIKSLMRMKINQNFAIISNINFHTKVRVFIRLVLSDTFTIVSDIKTKIAIRMQNFIKSFTVKMQIKAIVAIFYKVFERGDLTLEQMCNDEQVNTLQKLLWREIK